MNNKVQLVRKSGNAKTGPMPVTTSSRRTCPAACVFNHGNGCYADAGYYTRLNWDEVTSGRRGLEYKEFLDAIAALPLGTLWRHNVAGDLQGSEDAIDGQALKELTLANNSGFTVNASANTIPQAVEYFKDGLPTVVVLPVEHTAKTITVEGVRIVTCPATYRDDVTCKTCGLCQVATRKVVVGFPAHGGQAKKASIIARG
mgnify:CR=1 FL=1